MADKNLSAANASDCKQDPNKVADEVVNNLKSQGLFDQFRKECLEELEHLEAYRMLKQRVENHVASFLSKYKWSEKMSKNNLRDNLRMNINRSENLLNGIDRLIEQILATKSDSLSERIASEIDKHLGIDQVEELAPGTEPSVDEALPGATTSSTISSSSEAKSTKAPPPVKSVEASQSHSALPTPQGSALSGSQMLPQATTKATVKIESEQNSKKQLNDNPAKTLRSSLTLSKGLVGTSQSSQVLAVESSGNSKVQSLPNQNKKESPEAQGGSSDTSKAKANMENNAKNQKLVKDHESNKLKRDTEKGLAKSEKSTVCTSTVNVSSKTEECPKSEGKKAESIGNSERPSSEVQLINQSRARNEQLSLPTTDKAMRMPVNRNGNEVKSSTENLEESKKENDCISEDECDLASDVADTGGTKKCDKPSIMKDMEESSVKGTVAVGSHCSGDTNQLKDKQFEDVSKKDQTPSIGCAPVKRKQDWRLDAGEDLKVKADVKLHDVDATIDNRKEKEIKKVAHDIESSTDRDLASDKTESVNAPKGNDSGNEKEGPKSKVEKDVSDETSERKEIKDDERIDDTCKDPFVSKVPIDDLPCRSSQHISERKGLSLELPRSTEDDCKEELEDIDRASNQGSFKNIQELETFMNSTDDTSGIDPQLGLGQRRVKRRKRLISEDEEKHKLKAAKVDESESTQIAHDSKPETGIEEYKPKKARGRPRKSGGVKTDSQHSSDSEMPADEFSVVGLNRTEPGKTKYRCHEEPIETRGVKRQRSVGSESNTSDTCVEHRDMESHRRTRRQIKPKRCYSPSDGK